MTKTRVVPGEGAAAGSWVVEAEVEGRWIQAALPDRTKAEARETERVVREHGLLIGR